MPIFSGPVGVEGVVVEQLAASRQADRERMIFVMGRTLRFSMAELMRKDAQLSRGRGQDKLARRTLLLRMRNIAGVLTLAFLPLLLAPQAARAEFSVCNQSLDVLNVAIGYEEDGEFQTEGWWSVGANRCADVIRKPLKNRYIYVYAEDVFGQPVTQGPIPSCVGMKRFLIRGTKDCWLRGHREAGFLEVDTRAQERWTLFLKNE